VDTNNHNTHVYVGLAGEGKNIGTGGLLRRVSTSEEWEHIDGGLPDNPQVRALLIHPENPSVIYAGTQLGVYRSDDRGTHWEALEPPTKGTDVWSLAFHPQDPNIIYAGYEPCAIYRSETGGQHWRKMDTGKVVFPHITTYMPPVEKRVIGITCDPCNPMDVYAAIEVGGLLGSSDGGESWESVIDGPYLRNNTLDLHGVVVNPSVAGLVYIITQVAMFRSRDKGRHWEHVQVEEMFPGGSYCRAVLIAPDNPRTMYLAAGSGGGGAPKGTVESGALFKSADGGEIWSRVDIGDTPTSRMFQVAIDRKAPSHIYCCASYGQIYESNDYGLGWEKSQLPSDLSSSRHIYSMVCG